MAWTTLHCHVLKLRPSNFITMLTLTVVGSYGQVHYTVAPSTSLKITVSTFEEKQISILDSVHIQSDTDLVNKWIHRKLHVETAVSKGNYFFQKMFYFKQL